MSESPYDILQVPRDADQKSIHSAFRRKAKVAHPDAGGSPEAFAKISRALAILTNPTTRDRYDRTGEAEPGGPDNEHIEINNMVLQAVLYAVSQGDARFTDIVRGGIEHMNAKIFETDQEIAQHKAAARDQIDKYEAVIKRLSRKKSAEPDMLTTMLNGAIGQTRSNLEANLAQLEPRLRKIRAAREILSGYKYAADRREQSQQQGWTGLQDMLLGQDRSAFFTR